MVKSFEMRSIHQGFTLIELIMVIVILGILAAAAAPHFIDLSTNTRLAAISAMQNAVTTGASLAHSKAVIEGVNISAANAVADLDGDGVNEVFAFGYPNSASQHTMEWIVDGLGQFTYTAGRYNLGGISNCYVQYTNATLGNGPTISAVTGGC